MRDLAFRVVEFAVLHARACAHALHVPRGNALDVAHAVLVPQLATQHVADDFHILVAVRAKAPSGSNAVFINHAQVGQSHVVRVVVIGK